MEHWFCWKEEKGRTNSRFLVQVGVMLGADVGEAAGSDSNQGGFCERRTGDEGASAPSFTFDRTGRDGASRCEKSGRTMVDCCSSSTTGWEPMSIEPLKKAPSSRENEGEEISPSRTAGLSSWILPLAVTLPWIFPRLTIVSAIIEPRMTAFSR